MDLALVLCAGVLAALLGAGAWRRERALRLELEALTARLAEVMGRVEAAENELVQTAASSGVAEQLLLEKGIADEDELEDVRRRLGGEDEPPREGDDALN